MTDPINPADAFDDAVEAKELPEPKSVAKKRTKAAPKSVSGSRPTKEKEGRITIILEENDNIPPNGQFIAVNGRAFIVRPGVKVSVPEAVLSVLNDAVEKRPVTNDGGVIIGYRDAMRFPYRIVNS